MKTLGREGGWSDEDGGTYRGIARNSNPLWAGWPILDTVPDKKHIPHEIEAQLDPLVRELYRVKYWDIANCNAIADSVVAAYVFDMAVQHDPYDAVRILQRAINELRKFPITVDGMFGKETAASLREILIDPDGQWELMEKLRLNRGEYYVGVVIHNPAEIVNLKGWFRNRVFI